MGNGTSTGAGIGVTETSGGAPATPTGDARSRRKQLIFRVLSWVTAAWLLLLFVFGLIEVVVMWLPGETLAAMFEDDFASAADIEPHRSHFMAVGIVAWAAVLAAMVQLRKPERRAAPMLQLVAIAVAGSLVYGLSGTFGDWVLEEGTVLVPVLLLAWLHPRFPDLVRRPTFDRDMLGLTAVASLPWAVFAVNHLRLQLGFAAGDTHAEMEHWATAAMMAIVIVACGVIGSSHLRGWRLPAGIAGVGSLLYGAHSLAFPGPPSAASTLWGVAAIVWGVLFVVSIVRRSRGTRPALQ